MKKPKPKELRDEKINTLWTNHIICPCPDCVQLRKQIQWGARYQETLFGRFVFVLPTQGTQGEAVSV
jgi:hypothetical protein